MIKKIGVENFRVFKEYTEFEIRPFTLLTGPNNSGKSSLTKLLLLISNGLEILDFKNGKHNLESFEKVLNWQKKDNNLLIQLYDTSSIFGDKSVEYNYEKGEIIDLHLKIENQSILKYWFEFKGPKEDWEVYLPLDEYLFEYYAFDYRNFIDLIFNIDPPSRIRKDSEVDFNYYSKLSGSNQTQISPEELTIQNYRQKFPNEYNEFSKSLQAIYNEVNKLDKNYLLYKIEINSEDKTEYYREELLSFQEEIFSEIEIPVDPEFPEDIHSDILGAFRFHINHLIEIIEFDLDKKFQQKFNLPEDQKINLIPNKLHKILFDEKWFHYDSPTKSSGTTLFQYLKYLLNTEEVKGVDFISANRGSQKRVLQNESDNEIDKIIVDFVEGGKKNIEFIEKIFKILGIKGELNPVRYENTISVVYLKYGGKNISLADVGYGFSQIIPIILKLIMSKDLLIIEEPEANLHPALQSKFADILIAAKDEFPNKKFILETHSEYLIRKLQYLTAKAEISTEHTVIYYFNADEYVTHEEPKVKKIEITETGNLTENFGPGFFDEATKLQFDLMKVKKEQKN